MSAHPELPTPERLPAPPRELRYLFTIGLIALIVTALVALFEPQQVAFSWLFSFSYFYTIAVGALFWVILHHAVDADWSVLVRRILEHLARLLPYLAIAFIPILFFAPQLYHWLTPEAAHDPLLALKKGYLNWPFFVARAVGYFLFFTWAARAFWRDSVRQDTQDATGALVMGYRSRRRSYVCIALLAVCLTFSTLDWLMGLDYHWYSTMWGVYLFAGGAQASLALTTLVVLGLQRRGFLKAITQEHYHIIGKLLFAFTVFWAYIAFSQYMLIWYANIPEETIFYIRRNTGSWNWVSYILVYGHFVIPFFLLLTQAAKKNPVRLGFAAGWILVLHAVDHYWIIMPNLHPAGFSLHPADVTAWLALAMLLTAVFLRLLYRTNLFPSKDPRLEDCVGMIN